MKILFGTEHFGKDTSECPSGFLIWIIEKYLDADWLLINACKTELSSRLKIDWTLPTKKDVILSEQLEAEKKKVRALNSQIDLLEKCLIMSTGFGATRINVDGYLCNPKYLDQQLQLIKQANA